MAPLSGGSPIPITERFRQSRLAMAVLELDGTFLQANAALGALLGQPAEALVGRRLQDLAADHEGRAALADMLRHGEAQGPAELASADGPVPVLLTLSLIRDDRGAPWHATVVVQDQREQRRAEQALLANESRWRALVQHTASVVFTADAEGTVTWSTAGGAQQLTSQSYVGRDLFDLVHAADHAELRRCWDDLLSGRARQRVVELRAPRADGDLAWTQVVLSDLRDDPHVQALVGHAIDVTERHREAEQRAALEQRYRARFHQSAVPQALLGLDGRLVEVNDAYAALLGRRPDELVGLRTADLEHGDRADLTELEEVLTGRRTSARYERVMADAAGRPVPVLVDVTLLRDPDGTPTGVVGFLQDLRALRDAEQRRQQQEEWFLALSLRASEAVLVVAGTGAVVYASPAVQKVLEVEPAELLGRPLLDLVEPEERTRTQRLVEEVLDGAGSRTERLRLPRGEGGCWVQLTVSDLRDSAVGGLVVNLQDVTEQQAAEQALLLSERRFRTIAETAEEGIWATDAEGRTLFVNSTMAAMLGRDVEELYAEPVFVFLDPEDVEAMRERIAHRAEQGTARYELGYSHPDGRRRTLWIAASPLPGADGTAEGSLALVTDVTEVRRAERELRQAALTDALTGLPNRALLLDRLTHALERGGTGTAVLFLDLDHFKLVNDSHGHAVGDELLRAVADRLRTVVRPGDTVARFGGDEFVVVCEDVDEPAATALGQAVLDAVAEPVTLSSGTAHVRASLGVAVAASADPHELLRFADTAMYAAKSGGRARLRVSDRALVQQAEERYALASDLRAALDSAEVVLHHQPVVDLRSGRVVGAEALARWTHPQRGDVPPSRFVRIAELTGLAPTLDRWAVRRALADAALLQREGAMPADAYTAVNVSAQHLADTALEQLVVDACAAAGLPPERVVLEITESAIMADPQLAVALLGRLRARGFRVAVDDFGTGQSSLAYLRDLPITTLKIDRSFVSAIEEDRDALAIVASVVDLARAIGAGTVAEGVETRGQAALLRKLGCRHAQGWLWSPAVPVAQVLASDQWQTGFPPSEAARGATRLRADDAVGAEHGLPELLALHRRGASLTTIAAALNKQGFRRPDGTRWHHATVARAVAAAAFPRLDDDGDGDA